VLLAQYNTHPPKDFSHTIVFCISTLEVGLAFVAACAPYMKPLILKIAPKILGSTRFGKTTGRPSRAAYELSERTWKGTETKTQIDSSGHFDVKAVKEKNSKDKMDIVLTMETEVKWQDTPSMKLQASTESLV
jgi:hypothetical protein